jgi:hypothetical protein
VARHWPFVRPDDIANYLVHWDLDDENPGKAYPDDRCSYNDCWQLLDFMRKLGLPYPLDDASNGIVAAYRFDVPSE